QLALFVFTSRPARQALGDNLLRELIELRLALLQRAFEVGLDLRQGATAHPGVDEIGGFHERRDRQADWNVENPVLALPVLADQDHDGALGLEPYEFDVLQPRI